MPPINLSIREPHALMLNPVLRRLFEQAKRRGRLKKRLASLKQLENLLNQNSPLKLPKEPKLPNV